MVPNVWWNGLSGQQYTFELHPFGARFLPLPGVYVVARRIVLSSGAGYIEALYVGETESLEDRLNSGALGHDGLKRAAAYSPHHMAVMICHERAQRLRIETDLRHGLDPICNRQDVPEVNALLAGLLRQ